MRWCFEYSSDWNLLEGPREGQSQAYAYGREGRLAVLDHPMDLRIHTSSACHIVLLLDVTISSSFRMAQVISTVPKLTVQVYQADDLSRHELTGYGFCDERCT